MVCRRLTMLCLCLVSVIVRHCQPMQVDLNAKLQNNQARKDLDQTLENAGLEVVDIQRMPDIRRTYNTNAAAEVKQTEGDRQITLKTRADWLQEEEEENEEDEEEEEEEEWLPVYIEGKQKISGEHHEGRRVKREVKGKSPKLQQEATDGQLQYTTLDTRNLVDEASDELAEAGNGEVGTSGEDKEAKDDKPTETPKDSETLEERSEDGTAKEGETVKQHDGEVNVKAEAPSDDAEEEEEEGETPTEDDTQNKEKSAEADDKQNKKETSTEKETSEKDDVPTKDDTGKKDDSLEKDAIQQKNESSKKDDVLKKAETQQMDETPQKMKKPKNDQKSKEESKETRVSEELVQNEENGNADGHLTNSDLSIEKGKEPVGDDDGSGSEEDEKTGFLSEAPDSKEDTSNESRTKDEESEGKVALLNDDDDDDDDEAKEQLTATPNEKDADEDKDKQTQTDEDKQTQTDEDKDKQSQTEEDKQSQTDEDKDKQSPTNEDKNENGKDSKGSNEDSDEASGEAEEQNIEPKTGSEKEPDNPEKEHQHGEDDGTTKKESTRSKWQYYGAYGPGNWSREFSGCNSDHQFQSPINIVPEQAHFDDTREKITFTMTHSEKKCNSVLFNDAKTAKVIFENMDVRVNGLDKIYQVAWVQFRWGNANNAGSEHVVAGNRYPLEMQVLCYDKENYADLMVAEWVADNTSSTIVMLATLFEISNNDNPLLNSVVENLKSIQSPGQNISIPSLDLKGLLPKKSDYFYRYSGSLTSPPCQGGAEWIVFHEHQTISPSQIAKFRQLHEEDFEGGTYSTVDYNWRPVQPLNGRVVTRSFPIPKKGNPNTLKPSAIRTPSSSSHCSPAIDISVCTLLFMWKLFLG